MSSFRSQRAQAAFIGFAIGDAYGRELEFLSGMQVRTQRVRLDRNFRTSDETHMALYTAQAILKHDDFNIDQFGHALAASLIDWTQDPRTAQSSPGKNCLKGVQNYLQNREWRRSGIPHSDGSGSIMRICPIAIAFSSPRLEQAAEISALITHSHPNALAAAVSCARLLRGTLEKETITAQMVLNEALLIEKEYSNAPLVPAALRAAVLQSNRPSIDWLDEGSIPPGDGGWKACSALGLALTAALHFKKDARNAIDKAARINGDSDGVAALAGMFVGASMGFEALPLDWVQALKDVRDIASFADNLCRRTPKNHWLLDKCTALEKKGARFSVQGNDFLILVPQTSTAGILALRPIAEELAIGLEVEGGAVALRFPKSKAPPSFVARYDQSKPKKESAPATKQSYVPPSEVQVIDEDEEEIWEAEVIDEEPHHAAPPPPSSKQKNQSSKEEKTQHTQRDSVRNHRKEIAVQWIKDLQTPGKLGFCMHPTSINLPTHAQKELGSVLDRLAALYNVDTLFSMSENHELERHGIQQLVVQASKRRITVYRNPCTITQTPSYHQIEMLVRIALPLLDSGKNVLCHGLEDWVRTGTLLSCILIGHGFSAKQAMRSIRFVHSGAIENIYQEQFIFEFAQQWNRQ